MELRMRSRRFSVEQADWLAGATAGFVAGAILMVLELIWAATALGGNPWITTHKIAAIALGERALHSMTQFEVGIVAVALAIHYLLGIFTGLVLAAIVAVLRFEHTLGMVLLTGIVLGFVVYLVNFYVMTAYFPWFKDLRGSATMIAHLAFGVAVAGMYWNLGRIEHSLQ